MEIDKLAARHGCQIVERYDDAAVTGDSHSGERPGLADLLTAAKAGAFKMVLLVAHEPLDAESTRWTA